MQRERGVVFVSEAQLLRVSKIPRLGRRNACLGEDALEDRIGGVHAGDIHKSELFIIHGDLQKSLHGG